MLVKLVCIIVVGKDGVACCGLPQISERGRNVSWGL